MACASAMIEAIFQFRPPSPDLSRSARLPVLAHE